MQNLRFPSRTKYEQQWEMWSANVRVTKPTFVPNRNNYFNHLCFKHFEEDTICHAGKHKRLKPYTIPTKFFTEQQVCTVTIYYTSNYICIYIYI